MKKNDDQRIKHLIKCVKNEEIEKLDELKKIYGRHIKKTIELVSPKMYNTNRKDLLEEAYSILGLALMRYDEQKHADAYFYIGNFIRDELRRKAKQDQNGGFPGIPLSQNTINNDEQEPLYLVENSAIAVGNNPEPTPEEYACRLHVQERIDEYGKSLEGRCNGQKKTINDPRVFNDLIRHKDDQSLRSIERRTGIPKTTVSGCKTRIFRELKEIFRTDYPWVALLKAS